MYARENSFTICRFGNASKGIKFKKNGPTITPEIIKPVINGNFTF